MRCAIQRSYTSLAFLCTAFQDQEYEADIFKKPVILICHSLGGLIAKRAYVLSKQLKEYRDLSERIRAMVFLATPHRGSNLAEILSRILQITPTISTRTFVNELHPNSATIQSINEEFPNHCQELQLHSFYETNPMSLGIKKVVIVPKDSAVLGYENERSTYLNANHREVCKFTDVEDVNYRSVRNALASTLDELRRTQPIERRETDYAQQHWLKECLDVDDTYNDDYHRIDNERIHGSCAWMAERHEFQRWVQSADPQLYWLSAKPGTGKSVLSSFVISHLKRLNKDCAFFFFAYGDKSRVSVSLLLRSIAWQMASTHREVFELIQKLCKKDPQLPKADYRTVWRKLFLEGIFRLGLYSDRYLVVDALDECKGDADLVPLLIKAAEFTGLRIFITTRNQFNTYGVTCPPRLHIITETIPPQSTAADVRLYVDANLTNLPALGSDRELARKAMLESIIEKSSGCFLWVRLVINELRRVHTAAEVRKILQEVPSDMDELYMRILSDMSNLQYGKNLTQAILAWATCSARPLSTDELHQALQMDIDDNIDSVERAITSNCGQIVYVDAASRVKLVHETAREFLLHPRNRSEFAMEKRDVHKRLAMVCLRYLCSDEMSGPKHKKLGASSHSRERSSFVSYASNSLSDHVALVSSEDDDFLHALAGFLNSHNVLTWIEYIAKESDLGRLVHTGRAFRQFLQRRQKRGLIPLGRDVALLDTWATDIFRLATKFGRNLISSPSAIYTLIPPLCPSETGLKKQFGASTRSLDVTGLSQTSWDDCSSVVTYPNEYPSAVACSSPILAVGFASGCIRIHHETTCEELRRLSHNEPIKLLRFGHTGCLLASVSSKSICIWSTDSWQQVWRFELSTFCVDLIFIGNDHLLLVVLRSNQLLIWDMGTGTCGSLASWLEDLDEEPLSSTRWPIAATIGGGGSKLLAVVYRGEDIIVYDIENERILDYYGQDVGSLSPRTVRRSGVAFVRNMVFSRSSDADLLAASYSDGELVMFNTLTNKIQARTYANAHTLTSSPDGLTLACGNSAGMILIFEFETLKLLYRITSEGYGIKALSFTTDSRRLVDIRGPFCRIWDPPVLTSIQQREDDEQNSDTFSISTAPQDYSLGNTEQTTHISAFACLEDLNIIICGRFDGTVCIFDGKTGKQSPELIQKPNSVAITILTFDSSSSILIAADINNRIIAFQTFHDRVAGWKTTKLFIHRTGIAITQVLANASCTQLLISSKMTDALYEFGADGITESTSLSWPERQRYRWNTHPVSGDQLILMTDNIAYIYTWKSLEQLTPTIGIQMTGALLPELAIRSITPYLDGNLLATTFADSPNSRSRSLFLWHTSDFSPASPAAAPIPDFQPLADQIDCILGTYSNRLVFLHQDGWICSVNPASFDVEAFDRHFFFPTDWLSAVGGLMLGIFRNGNIAFVQRDEVAIVKRGMETLDAGSARSGIGKRPSLARSARSSEAGIERMSLLSLT